MLSDKDRIFKNLYNDLGSDLDSAKKETTGLILKKYFPKEKIGLLMK